MTDRYNRNSPIPMIPSLPIDYLSVALPPTPKARAEAERVNIIIDPAWAPVTGEISRIVNSALWSCEGRPVTHDLVAALVSIIEFRIQDSDAIWANRNHHGASLRFIIPLAPGFDVVCEPFKVHPTANTPPQQRPHQRHQNRDDVDRISHRGAASTPLRRQSQRAILPTSA